MARKSHGDYFSIVRVAYVALLEQKTRALDQAAPLVGWQLPECFAQLGCLLEARLKKHNSREYVQVLRLMETFDIPTATCSCAAREAGGPKPALRETANDKRKSDKDAGQKAPGGVANSDPEASHNGASP
jgi:hypothetical protein